MPLHSTAAQDTADDADDADDGCRPRWYPVAGTSPDRPLLLHAEAVELVLRLADAGTTFAVEAGRMFVQPPPAEADAHALRRWRWHVLAVLSYAPPAWQIAALRGAGRVLAARSAQAPPVPRRPARQEALTWS
mgnify:CR=1 FL=1